MKVQDIKSISLLGAGMIGNGLALHFAKAGYEVKLYSRTQATLDKALESVKGTLAMLLKVPADSAQVKEIVARIKTFTDMKAAVAGAAIIVESVAEDLKLKQEVFKELDEVCGPDTILATNTSVIRITDIAAKAKNRKRIVGTHFWNPPYLLPLVEVVKGQDTTDEVMEMTYQFMKLAGKKPIKCLLSRASIYF